MAKVTKRERFTEIAEVLTGLGETELAEFATKEAERLTRKSGAERKPTATQIANEALKGQIVEALAGTEGMVATEIALQFEVSVQKVAQLMKQLVEAGAVARIEGKGKEKTKFVLAEAGE